MLFVVIMVVVLLLIVVAVFTAVAFDFPVVMTDTKAVASTLAIQRAETATATLWKA